MALVISNIFKKDFPFPCLVRYGNTNEIRLAIKRMDVGVIKTVVVHWPDEPSAIGDVRDDVIDTNFTLFDGSISNH